MLAGSNPAERNPDRLLHSWVPARRRAAALELLAELEREGTVQRIPWVAQAALHDAYRSADAFVMPSHAEGFGFTNVEAMSFGLPVITSTAGPSAEIVAEGDTGMRVAPGDVAGLHEAMARLAGDVAAARRMGDAGRTAFLRSFTLERFRDGLRALYLEAVSA